MQLTRMRSSACVRNGAAKRSTQVRPVTSVRTAAESVQVSTNGVSASAAGTNALAFEDLSDIIRLVQETDIVEFELKSKKFHLSVRKREALAAELAAKAAAAGPVQYISAPAPAAAAPAPAPAAAPAPVAPAAAPAPKPAAPKPAAPSAPKGVEVTSPMAGTLYRAAAPGEPQFVKEGDIVRKGQTVCIIEAMKLMNEIEAEVGGEVIKFLAENGSAISPGQPILLLKPIN